MPNRILREGILASERIAKLDFAAEVFYRRLMSVVDDFGRYYAMAKLLRAACYPLRLDDVTDADIERWVVATSQAGLVAVYAVGDKRYLQLLDFRQQARSKTSKFPAPDEQTRGTCAADATQATSTRESDAQQMKSFAHLDGDGDGDEREARAAAKRGTRLSADWRPSPEQTRWAVDARPDLDVNTEAEKFRDYWHAKPGKDGTKLDWGATWRNWIRNAKAAASVTPLRQPDTLAPSPASQRRLA